MLKRVAVCAFSAAFLLTVYSAAIRAFPLEYGEIIKAHSGLIGNDLVFAVIHAESKFKPDARSGKGASGLMQVTEPTAEWIASRMGLLFYDPSLIYEPEINISIGCYYLNWLYDYYGGDLTLTLCAYNAGQGNVDGWLRDENYSSDGKRLDAIPFPETRQYVKRVKANRLVYAFLLTFDRRTK
ncbi:MAG: lytic transglycosylase domain-containing protein [Defluviitaleaceae bacterium]|nr:lytic transglycosylase domain-containing protein [Defluviitaleaceae bacterium]